MIPPAEQWCSDWLHTGITTHSFLGPTSRDAALMGLGRSLGLGDGLKAPQVILMYSQD